MLASLQSALGLAALIGLCVLLSERRGGIRAAIVARSLGLQILLAVLFLKLPGSAQVFLLLNDALTELQAATEAGTSFIFGYIGGGEAPFDVTNPGASFIFAFQALPLVIVVSALSALLMYWKILPVVMRGFSFVLEKTLNIGGALGLAVSANAFLGMVESPLLIRPYIEKLSRGELFGVMCAGMATIAGTMLALEASIISAVVPNSLGHLISCSIISLPAAIWVAHLLVPVDAPVTRGDQAVASEADSSLDALTRGTQDGLQLYLNIIAMIIVVVALVFLANSLLGLLPYELTLEQLLGWLLAPLALMVGIPWSEALVAGELLGTRVVLTELVAYVRLGSIDPAELSERSRILVTYALCGFANLVGLGIMISGLTTMAPARRPEILQLGFRSLVGGTIATATTAAIVGILI